MLQAHLASPFCTWCSVCGNRAYVCGVTEPHRGWPLRVVTGGSAEGLSSSHGQRGVGMRRGEAKRVRGVTVQPVRGGAAVPQCWGQRGDKVGERLLHARLWRLDFILQARGGG